MKNYLLKTNKKLLFLFIALLSVEIFLRFYQIAERNPFGWDQVDNAWAAKNIIVNHQFPLVGMVAKQNSGFNIGPLYYYAIAIVYFLFNLNPIASGVFAGITSIISFFIIFFVTKKLFNTWTAFIAIFIYAAAAYQIIFDRVQWPVDLVPAISLLVLYCLYQVLNGEKKYLYFLALSAGIMFQLHFTAIFVPIIIVLSLPFVPWKKLPIIHIVGAIGVFVLFLIPNIVLEFQKKGAQSHNMSVYLSSYYHGFHLKRVMQLTGDALIQFQPLLTFPFLATLKYVLVPLFLFVYLFKQVTKPRIVLSYLISIWFIVPWFVFATYSGELSDYYFSYNRFVALVVISYLLYWIAARHLVLKIAVVLLLVVYGFMNVQIYFQNKDTTLLDRELKVKDAVNKSQQIQFTQGVPESYLYYYYMRQKGIVVYDKK